MSKRNTPAGTYVPGIVSKSGSVRDLAEVKDFRSAIHAIHAEVGDSHFGDRTEYEDGSFVREFLRGPKDGGETELVGIVRFIPGATPAKSARKAKPARKTARKSGSKAAESGKPTVHFTAKQKEILLAGLRKFVNGLR